MNIGHEYTRIDIHRLTHNLFVSVDVSDILGASNFEAGIFLLHGSGQSRIDELAKTFAKTFQVLLNFSAAQFSLGKFFF